MTISPSLLVYFPMLLGLWMETPFTAENTKVPQPPTFLNREEIRQQSIFYGQLREPELRSRVALELAGSNNPAAVQFLANVLGTERDDRVVADLLSALDQLRHIAPCRRGGELAELIRSKRETIRGRALALSLAGGGDLGPILEALAGETSPFVQRLVWQRLAEAADTCPPDRLLPLLKSDQPLTRAGIAVVLCRQDKDPDGHAELVALTKDSSVAVRTALSETVGARPAGATALLQALAKDEHPSVRCGVAAAVGTPERMNLHLSLSADPDSEVRRLACTRLREYPVEAVTQALLVRFSDPVEAPRLAAEDSLIALKPAAAVEDRLIELHLGDPPSCASAARVLGALRVKRAVPRLREVLAAGGEHEFVRRSIIALGELVDRDAWQIVCGQKAHPRPDVRRAVAWTLGQLAVPDSFPVLVELSKDKEVPVHVEALTSMGIIGDPFFTETLTRNVIDVSSPSARAERRATAAWSLAKGSAMPGEDVLKQYEKLCLKRAIPIMGMLEYDIDYVRASCAFALVHLALRDESLRARAEGIVKKIADPNQDPLQAISALPLQVFSRQALDYLNGKTSEPEPVPVVEVIRTVMPVSIRQE